MRALELTYYCFAMLGALGSFIGGVTNLFAYRQTRRGAAMKRSVPAWATAVVGVVSMALFVGIMLGTLFAKERYKNEQLTAEAWNSYNKGAFDDAIDKARECILEFQEEALRQERQLRDAKTDQPPKGRTTHNQAAQILSRGLLNDVATCWVIIGMSEMKLKRVDKAISAFEKTRQFTYARTYDPGWDGFWSPADKAADYIKGLRGQLY